MECKDFHFYGKKIDALVHFTNFKRIFVYMSVASAVSQLQNTETATEMQQSSFLYLTSWGILVCIYQFHFFFKCNKILLAEGILKRQPMSNVQYSEKQTKNNSCSDKGFRGIYQNFLHERIFFLRKNRVKNV